jgi:hypothetical protein
MIHGQQNVKKHVLNIGTPFLFYGATAPIGPGYPHYEGFTITLRHTTVGRIPLDE